MQREPSGARSKTLCSAAALLLLCGTARGEEESVEQILAALIERTNALESFHVVYDVEGRGEGGEMLFTYEAPGLAHFSMAAQVEGLHTWIVGERIYLQAPEKDWLSAPFPEPTAAEVALDELFAPRSGALEGGVMFTLDVTDVPDGETAGMDISISRSDSSRPGLLLWLRSMQQRPDEVELEDDELVLRGEAFELHFSTEHGFPTSIRVLTADAEIVMHLRECSLDEPLDDALVSLPRAARKAPTDPDLTRSLAALSSTARVRLNGFGRVAYRLREGDLDWDSESEERWDSFLEELHMPLVETGAARVAESVEARINEFAAQVHEWAEHDRTDEQWAALAPRIEAERASLEERLGGVFANYLGSLPALELEQGELGQLLEAERLLVRGLFQELLIEPALEHFDQALDVDHLRDQAWSPAHALSVACGLLRRR